MKIIPKHSCEFSKKVNSNALIGANAETLRMAENRNQLLNVQATQKFGVKS